jgi:protein involved in gliding motility SprA
MGRLDLPNPQSIQDLYTYDPITDRYIYTQTLGSFNISYPIILTPAEYQELIMKEQMKAYFKEKLMRPMEEKKVVKKLKKTYCLLFTSILISSNLFSAETPLR